ncbi:MAG: S41 family peptidase [Planctomycetes bacterium]|nr:S41 family peptidase [Planctomycetota bacterium]
MRRKDGVTTGTLLLAVLPLAAAAVCFPRTARGGETDAVRVREILKGIEGASLDEAWNAVDALEAIGTGGVPEMLEALKTGSDTQKLIIGKVLVNLGDAKKAVEIYTYLLGDDKVGGEAKTAACGVVGMTPELFGREEIMDMLRKALYSSDPAVRVAAGDTLLRFGVVNEAVDTLRQMSVRNDGYGEDAALVLAEHGHLNLVERRIYEIWGKPTPNGRRAFMLLRAKSEKTVFPGYDVLREIYENIQNYYVDAEEIEEKKLVTATARGMLSSLDPFSSYLDEDDVKDMEESLGGRYGGIGAYVGMHNGIFTIISPIYEGPAYRAGLRSLDQVLEVGGKDTTKMRFMEVVKNLKGTPGTEIVIKVYRGGWEKPRDFTIVRERITIDSVMHRMLPGGIGYIRLTRFGDTTTTESRDAIKELLRDGAKSFILDLRDNGGGLLDEAAGVADLFIDRGELIVRSEGRPQVSPRRDYRARFRPLAGDKPLVVLVNTGSASASEIVAGAIQDLKRGTLVGETTYGKGSVQTLFPLASTLFKTRVRLTIAKYYLPNGRSIHEKGVEPDITAKPAETMAWKINALVDIEEKVEDYVAKLIKEHPDMVQKLAEFDNHREASYPGLQELLVQIDDRRLDSEDIRKYVRGVLRRRAADLRGSAFVADLEEDRVLRRGVLAMLRILGRDKEELPETYTGLAEEFPEEEEKETAAADKPVSSVDDPGEKPVPDPPAVEKPLEKWTGTREEGAAQEKAEGAGAEILAIGLAVLVLAGVSVGLYAKRTRGARGRLGSALRKILAAESRKAPGSEQTPAEPGGQSPQEETGKGGNE